MQVTRRKRKSSPLYVSAGSFRLDLTTRSLSIRDFIVLDFDHVDVDQTKRALATDDFIPRAGHRLVATASRHLFRSRIQRRHRDHFRALIKVLRADTRTGARRVRYQRVTCLLRVYDPDIIVKEDYKKFGHFTPSMRRHRSRPTKPTTTRTT